MKSLEEIAICHLEPLSERVGLMIDSKLVPLGDLLVFALSCVEEATTKLKYVQEVKGFIPEEQYLSKCFDKLLAIACPTRIADVRDYAKRIAYATTEAVAYCSLEVHPSSCVHAVESAKSEERQRQIDFFLDRKHTREAALRASQVKLTQTTDLPGVGSYNG